MFVNISEKLAEDYGLLFDEYLGEFLQSLKELWAEYFRGVRKWDSGKLSG